MDYTQCAKSILSELGGAGNVRTVSHCMTRLRFVLANDSNVNDEKVKAIPGVLGIMKKGGQYQIIIGNNVSSCYKEVEKLGKWDNSTPSVEPKKKHITPGSIVNSILDVISGSVSGIMAPLIGCGMIKILLVIFNLCGISSDLPTIKILATLGDAVFYFLPVLLGFTAAKKMGVNPILAATVCAVLIHPDLIALLGGKNSVTFLHIPVFKASYSSSVIPALLAVWLLSFVEPAVDKICPSWAKNIFKPMIILLIATPITLLILAPLGNMIGIALNIFMTFLQTKISWAALMLMAGLMPLIVMTGMHWAFMPATLQNLTSGMGDGLLLPGMQASNLAQGAACLAVMIRTKNKELKSIASASGVSALFAGITEPAMYGVTLRLKKPMIAAMIGSACGGLVGGIFQLKGFTAAVPSLLAIVSFVSASSSKNFIIAVIVSLVSMIVTFVLTLIIGFDDPASPSDTTENKIEKNQTANKKENIKTDIASPFEGTIHSLSEVPDETFSSGILGKGIAVEPANGKLYAPFDGTVDNLFDTYHAIGLISNSGVELLIHVGLETVQLKGKGFTPHIKDGDKIKKGQLLMDIDLDQIKKAGLPTITPIIVSNSNEYEKITITQASSTKVSDLLLTVE